MCAVAKQPDDFASDDFWPVSLEHAAPVIGEELHVRAKEEETVKRHLQVNLQVPFKEKMMVYIWKEDIFC